jgi:hypothetical protein
LALPAVEGYDICRDGAAELESYDPEEWVIK